VLQMRFRTLLSHIRYDFSLYFNTIYQNVLLNKHRFALYIYVKVLEADRRALLSPEGISFDWKIYVTDTQL